jgi:hypothetical protein
MSIEAMKQAVATIDKIIDGCNNVQEEKDIDGDAKTLAKLIKKDCFPTLEALCQAIAEAEKQEPVAFRNTETGEFCTGGFLRKDWAKWQLLYTTPPAAQRTWVGLTDEERSKIWGELPQTSNEERDACIFAQAIEAKLKEKNVSQS